MKGSRKIARLLLAVAPVMTMSMIGASEVGAYERTDPPAVASASCTGSAGLYEGTTSLNIVFDTTAGKPLKWKLEGTDPVAGFATWGSGKVSAAVGRAGSGTFGVTNCLSIQADPSGLGFYVILYNRVDQSVPFYIP